MHELDLLKPELHKWIELSWCKSFFSLHVLLSPNISLVYRVSFTMPLKPTLFWFGANEKTDFLQQPSGFSFLLVEIMYVCESSSAVSSSLRPHGYSPWNSPGQNTGVGSLFLLQGIFWTRDRTHSPESLALAGRFFTTAPPGGPRSMRIYLLRYT